MDDRCSIRATILDEPFEQSGFSRTQETGQDGDRLIVLFRVAVGDGREHERDGEVLEVRGEDGGPPYLVRWSDSDHAVVLPAHISTKGMAGNRSH